MLWIRARLKWRDFDHAEHSQESNLGVRQAAHSPGMDAPSCKSRGGIYTKGIPLEGQISTCGEYSSVHHHHQEVLNPAVWGTLPDKLLRLVLHTFQWSILSALNHFPRDGGGAGVQASTHRCWTKLQYVCIDNKIRLGSFATRLHDM